MHRCQWCHCSTEYQLCKDCEEKFLSHIKDYNYKFRLGDILYTIALVDHKSKYEIREVKLVNYKHFVLQEVKSIIKNENALYDFTLNDNLKWRWNHFITLRDENGNQYDRSPDEVYFIEDECYNSNKDKFEKLAKKKIIDNLHNKLYSELDKVVLDLTEDELNLYIQSKVGNIKADLVKQINSDIVNEYERQVNAKIEELENKNFEDVYLMGEQNLIYNMIKNFLKSEEAIKFNITGLDIKIEDGYVNAEWKFGKRNKVDIKN